MLPLARGAVYRQRHKTRSGLPNTSRFIAWRLVTNPPGPTGPNALTANLPRTASSGRVVGHPDNEFARHARLPVSE
jgi:hypothetical protein